ESLGVAEEGVERLLVENSPAVGPPAVAASDVSELLTRFRIERVERHEHARSSRVLKKKEEGILCGQPLFRKAFAPGVETEGRRRRGMLGGDRRRPAGAQLTEETGRGHAEDVQKRLAARGPLVAEAARGKCGALAHGLEAQPRERLLDAARVFRGRE